MILTPQELWKVLSLIHKELGPLDIFTSFGSNPKETTIIGGCLPQKRLDVTKTTQQEALRTFVSEDPLPTFGYLSYHYGLILKKITTDKNTDFPLGCLTKYALYFSYDSNTQVLEFKSLDAHKYSAQIKQLLAITPPPLSPPHLHPENLKTSLSLKDYINGLNEVIHCIHQGDTYQLNLSIEYEAQLKASKEDLFQLYANLFQKHPANHYAYLNAHPYTLISTSPESFLKVRKNRVYSSPIKGTAKISNDNESSQYHLLKTSPKEDAELSMIVDLIRNDIAYHCIPGSVQVTEHKEIFRVDNLLQMYSTVEGKLKPSSDTISLLIDAFPGGSITGVPKRKAMQIIEALEPHCRNVYCGCFLLFYDIDHMDSSIAIRTAFHNQNDNTFKFYAGSGITAKSNPKAEYEETKAKAEKFISLLQ